MPLGTGPPPIRPQRLMPRSGGKVDLPLRFGDESEDFIWKQVFFFQNSQGDIEVSAWNISRFIRSKIGNLSLERDWKAFAWMWSQIFAQMSGRSNLERCRMSVWMKITTQLSNSSFEKPNHFPFKISDFFISNSRNISRFIRSKNISRFIRSKK